MTKSLINLHIYNLVKLKSVVLRSAFSTVIHLSKRQTSACSLSQKRSLTSVFGILLSFGNGSPEVAAAGLQGVAVPQCFHDYSPWGYFSAAFDLAPKNRPHCFVSGKV